MTNKTTIVRDGVSSNLRFAIIVTLAFEAILLTASLCSVLMRTFNDVVTFSQIIGICSVAFLFLVHLLMACFYSNKTRRIYHCYLAATAILVCLFGFWSLRQRARSNYRWFIEDGIKSYGELVKIAESNRLSLTHQPRFLWTLDNKVTVSLSACTNHDGSLMVWIKPRANNPRLGYFYTSSSFILTNCPWDDRKGYFYHLTNGWYEF